MPISTFEKIRNLVRVGVLGHELCPELGYWHWPVVIEDEIPSEMQDLVYDCNGYFEVRWHGEP